MERLKGANMYPGIDLIEINRLANALVRTPKLKERLFTAAEIAQCEQKANQAESYAGKFAAKEAVLKALGTGLRGLKWVEIEVIDNELGRPEVHLTGAALSMSHTLGIYDIRVSISHSQQLAGAVALALTLEGQT